MLFNVLGEALRSPTIWLTIVFLIVCGRLMQWLINRLPMMCQSVHVIHVPWGILVIGVLTYLNGYISYKGLVVMAMFYLVSYPSMWYLNYSFTQRLSRILKERQATRETTGILIWANEMRWAQVVRRYWRKLFWSGLNEEIVNRIVDNHSGNGHGYVYHDRITLTPRDD